MNGVSDSPSTLLLRRRAPVIVSVRMRLALWNVAVLALALIGAGALLRHQVASDLYRAVDTSLQQRGDGQAHWPQDMLHRLHDHQRHDGGPPPLFGGGGGGGGRGGGGGGGFGGGNRGRNDNGPDGPHPKRNEWDSLRPRLLDKNGANLFPFDQDLPAWDKAAVKQGFETGTSALTTVRRSSATAVANSGTGSSNTSSGGEPFRIFTSPVVGDSGKIEAVVQSAAPLAGIEQTLDQLTRTLLTLIPVAILIAGGGAVFLTDRALRPVRTVTRAAARIEASDLSARLEVRGDDDFARLADRFNGMLGRLEEAFARREHALEQQRRFVADASHELRTPLTVIKANTSLALADPDLAPDYRDVLTEVDVAVDRTIHLAQDLFLLARSDSSQLILDTAEIPVLPLLEQVRSEMRRAHPAPAADIQVAVGEDSIENIAAPLTVWGDRSSLLRVLSNLAENALRHTPPSGTVFLRASIASGGGIVALEVADTGEGIAPEHLPHVTERFYRADSARAREGGGTGLGLAICEAIVHAHDGTMEIQSVVGAGTTVRVRLPRGNGCPQQAAQIAAAAR